MNHNLGDVALAKLELNVNGTGATGPSLSVKPSDSAKMFLAEKTISGKTTPGRGSDRPCDGFVTRRMQNINNKF